MRFIESVRNLLAVCFAVAGQTGVVIATWLAARCSAA
jgi:hypothetical protein